MSHPLLTQFTEDELYRGLKRADLTLLDGVLLFLEDDPRTFRSGYIKQTIWRCIRRYRLDNAYIRRLEDAALKYLQRPMTPEFVYMCKTMTVLATADFWIRVAEKMETGTRQEQLNASCLYPYSQGLDAGEKARREYKAVRETRAREYTYANVHLFTAYEHEKLIELLHKGEYWRDGQIVRREANPAELPIIYYMARPEPGIGNDTEFAMLDMSAVNIERLLPKLEQFLTEGIYGYVTTSWLYIIYLMRQMNDARVVPILIKFLETRVDYKFESVTKFLLSRNVLKVLLYYATPEAITVVEAPREDWQSYVDYFAGKSQGWVLSYP